MKSRKKIKIPKIAILVIIIAFIGLGAKGFKFPYNYFKRGQNPVTIQGTSKTDRTGTFLASAHSKKSYSDYSVILKNNLLRPLGWQNMVEARSVEIPTPPGPVVQRIEQPAPTIPASELVFTGIVNLDNELVALVEDTSKGAAYFLKKGDRLKDYIVDSITEEKIILVNGDFRISKSLGSKTYYNTEGQSLMSQLPDGQMTGNSVRYKTEEPTRSDESSSNLSALERMKARRRKELGQE